ncbi:type III-B CRISPR module RAMP protein Cmr1 [Acidithiobacillus caldus]
MRAAPVDLDRPTLGELQLFQEPPLDLECTLVTPLYGGGVRAGQVDPKMPIRGTSIRGQLRFWWRKAHRQQFLKDDQKTIDWRQMFVAERMLWGGLGDADTLAASKVHIAVVNIRQEKAAVAPAARYERRPDGTVATFPTWESWAGGKPGGYALFPAQGRAARGGVEVPPAELFKPGSLRWTLRVQFSDDLREDDREQVRTAIRWWASFGGVGARTRRGLGAVRVEGVDPVDPKSVQEQGYRLVLQKDSASADAVAAWQKSLEALQNFRQGEGIGRNPGRDRRPGRSRWPEADAVRRLARTNSSLHRPEHPAGSWFPRAQFGLPIIFHFKDRSQGDPDDYTLLPEGAERQGSPLFLRPYLHPDGQWYPAVLYIKPEEKVRLQLKKGRETHAVKAWPEDPEEQGRILQAIPPLKGVKDALSAQGKIGSPIAAFLNYFVNPQKFFQGHRGS